MGNWLRFSNLVFKTAISDTYKFVHGLWFHLFGTVLLPVILWGLLLGLKQWKPDFLNRLPGWESAVTFEWLIATSGVLVALGIILGAFLMNVLKTPSHLYWAIAVNIDVKAESEFNEIADLLGRGASVLREVSMCPYDEIRAPLESSASKFLQTRQMKSMDEILQEHGAEDSVLGRLNSWSLDVAFYLRKRDRISAELLFTPPRLKDYERLETAGRAAFPNEPWRYALLVTADDVMQKLKESLERRPRT